MTDLKRTLSQFDLTMIAVGSTIGSGIFLTPALVAHALPSPLWMFGVWIVGGLMALSGALTFAELGAMMPRAGGVYVFLSEAYGRWAGFLYGWAYFWVVNTGGVAALAIAFATYLGYVVPLTPTGVTAAAVCGLLLVTIINVFGVKAGGIFSDIFTVLKLAGIVFLLIIGFCWGSITTTDFTVPLPGSGFDLSTALAAAMVGVFWSYGGWQHATFAAAEARHPRRTIPRSLITAAVIVTALYLLINGAFLMMLTPFAMSASSQVAADAVAGVLGPTGGIVLSLIICISTIGTCGIYTLTAPRIYFAMATDRIFFRTAAAIHPRFHTPANAIALQTAWAIVLILFWGTFENLISYVVFTDWIFFGLTAVSLFLFRRKAPGADRPYRTPGYPMVPLFFIAVATWFVVNTFVQKPEQSLAGLGFLALGIPVYVYWERKRQKEEKHSIAQNTTP